MEFKNKENFSTLDEVLKSSWEMLRHGVQNFRHPFHWPVLATMNDAFPEVRTVILRGFGEDDRKLVCHCDGRTPKVAQIRDNPDVSWLFYHPKKQVQLRLTGTASVHIDDKTADAQWEKVRITSRVNYCAANPPGSPIEKPSSGLPDFIRDKAGKMFDLPEARKNFAAIVCRFDQMDWLMLKLTGNIRAKFRWADERCDAYWTIP